MSKKEPLEEDVVDEVETEEVAQTEEVDTEDYDDSDEEVKPPNPIVEMAIHDAKELATGLVMASATGVSAICRWLGVGAGTVELGARHAAKSAGDLSKKLDKSRKQIKF